MKKLFLVGLLITCLLCSSCTVDMAEEKTYVENVSSHTESMSDFHIYGTCVEYHLHYNDDTIEIENPTEENEHRFSINDFSMQVIADQNTYEAYLGGLVETNKSNGNRFLKGTILGFYVVYGIVPDEVIVTIKFHDYTIFSGKCFKDKEKHNKYYDEKRDE